MIVEHDIFIAAAPEKVWKTIASVDGMKAWLGPKEFEPRHGGKIFFQVNHEGSKAIIFGEVVQFDPPTTLAFTWTEQPDGSAAWPTPTLVTISLVVEGQGTRVKLAHSGFDQLPEATAMKEYEGYKRGWAMLHDLDKLKAAIEAA